MHNDSYQLMSAFVKCYLERYSSDPIQILDIGSRGLLGQRTYRDLFAEHDSWNYIGLDLEVGRNVDLCVSDPYDWVEIQDNSIDVVISGQALEHVPFPWVTMFEIGRVLRDSGLACIIAPSVGPEHRFPQDCWRFYPDGMTAFADFLRFRELEVWTNWKMRPWCDSVLVLQKPVMSIDEAASFRRRNQLLKAVVATEPILNTSYIVKQPNQISVIGLLESARMKEYVAGSGYGSNKGIIGWLDKTRRQAKTTLWSTAGPIIKVTQRTLSRIFRCFASLRSGAGRQ